MGRAGEAQPDVALQGLAHDGAGGELEIEGVDDAHPPQLPPGGQQEEKGHEDDAVDERRNLQRRRRRTRGGGEGVRCDEWQECARNEKTNAHRKVGAKAIFSPQSTTQTKTS